MRNSSHGWCRQAYDDPKDRQQLSDIEIKSRGNVLELMDKFTDLLEQECDKYTDYYGDGCGYSEVRLA